MGRDEDDSRRRRPLTVLKRVRCLACGSAYMKRASGGTVETNPGCPSCGYIGWIPAGMDFTPREQPPHHSDVDLPQHRASRGR